MAAQQAGEAATAATWLPAAPDTPGAGYPPPTAPGTDDADAALAEALANLDAVTSAWRAAHNL